MKSKKKTKRFAKALYRHTQLAKDTQDEVVVLVNTINNKEAPKESRKDALERLHDRLFPSKEE